MKIGTGLKSHANEGARMVLRDYRTGLDLEDGEGQKAALLLLGSDSDAVRRVEREFQHRNTEQAKRTRDARITPEAWEAHQLNKLVAATVGWEHCEYDDTTEFSPELIRRFYVEEPWARDQAQEFVDDRANFSGASKTN